MKKFFKTLLTDVNIYVQEFFFTSLLITFILLLLLAVIIKIKKIKIVKPYDIAINFLCCFYFANLFVTTLIHRIGTKIEPLADVFGEWSIYDGATMIYVNPKPILNIILFMPLCFAVLYILKSFFNKTFSDKKIILLTLIISFFTSLAIELMQLIFSIGTFQISDLVYNTAGGIIGAAVYIGLSKIIIHIKKARK